PREEGVDAFQEGVLIEPARGGQDREGRPLHAISEGRIAQLRIAQPPRGPIALSESNERWVILAPQLLAQQGGQQGRTAAIKTFAALWIGRVVRSWLVCGGSPRGGDAAQQAGALQLEQEG